MRYRLTVAWWLRWYLLGVILMSKLTGLEPDWDKVEVWMDRAIKITPLGDEDGDLD